MNFLASPPLVVAYALAGTLDLDLTKDPLGTGKDGKPVYLADIWPSDKEVSELLLKSIDSAMFRKSYESVFIGDTNWSSIKVPAGKRYTWDEKSTYVKNPPYFDGMTMHPAAVGDIKGARALAVLGDSVTTDHISPAGSIKPGTPAAQYLDEHGVDRKDYNSYGSRRGNHEVMIRGTFANIRLRNLLLDDVSGGYTRDFTRQGGPQGFIYDAAQNYAAQDIPLVVLGGKEYGSGSSRDWAAKGTRLLGVRAVIAESFERIHRSNLIGMGVIPLQFPEGESATSLKLDGTEVYDITGIEQLNGGKTPKTVHVKAKSDEVGSEKDTVEFDATVRIDTPGEADYYRNGGILQYVLRNMLRS
jgi:aconitate hydratase